MAAPSTLSEGAGLEETPELYLKLATECMKQVDGLISGHMSTSLKFNRVQCQYLADRLKMAVRSAESFIEMNSRTDDPDSPWVIQSLEVFKLLLCLSKEVESFIKDCCKDTWTHSAILLANSSEYTTSLGCNDLAGCVEN